MTAVVESPSVTETHSPSSQAELAALVAEAYARETPVYPIGGGTSLDFGSPAARPGAAISTTKLARVIDYPARDMTITAEAGITMESLANTLVSEGQWLPIDAPRVSEATLGGVVATAWSGPRRYGYGTMRDYVIGISAVDGRGTAFKAGGRVVKNVAGYDFCKLLTGSLGTLGVITQLTLKIKPRPESSAFLICDLRDFATAERLLAAIVNSATTPSAVELLVGPRWSESPVLGTMTAGTVARLAIGLEGMAVEVDWMLGRLAAEWGELGVTATHSLHSNEAAQLWSELCDFPATIGAPLVIKASVLPSHTTSFVELVRQIDHDASIMAHGGNGIVIARFSKFETSDVSQQLIGRLQPAAKRAGGSLVVLSTTLPGLTQQAIWGGATADSAWMEKVKRQFDPKNVLNPGRFVYANL